VVEHVTFFASWWRYCALMCPPVWHFLIPFQYNILAIALESCGHHYTWPTVSLRHCDSAWCLASELSWSISSYSHFCCLLRWLCRMREVNWSMHVISWLASNCCSKMSLYFLTIRRSLHFRRQAFSGVGSGTMNQLRADNGMSIHRAL